MLGAGLLVACAAPPERPALPPDVRVPQGRTPFGDRTMQADVWAWAGVFDRLKPGHPRLRVTPYHLPVGVSAASLKAYYDRILLTRGWRERPELARQDGRAWAFGYGQGRYVYAVVGLEPQYAVMGVRPLNILTDLPAPASP